MPEELALFRRLRCLGGMSMLSEGIGGLGPVSVFKSRREGSLRGVDSFVQEDWDATSVTPMRKLALDEVAV